MPLPRLKDVADAGDSSSAPISEWANVYFVVTMSSASGSRNETCLGNLRRDRPEVAIADIFFAIDSPPRFETLLKGEDVVGEVKF